MTLLLQRSADESVTHVSFEMEVDEKLKLLLKLLKEEDFIESESIGIGGLATCSGRVEVGPQCLLDLVVYCDVRKAEEEKHLRQTCLDP